MVNWFVITTTTVGCMMDKSTVEWVYKPAYNCGERILHRYFVEDLTLRKVPSMCSQHGHIQTHTCKNRNFSVSWQLNLNPN